MNQLGPYRAVHPEPCRGKDDGYPKVIQHTQKKKKQNAKPASYSSNADRGRSKR